MPKSKKITVRFYLNKGVKPKDWLIAKTYPVYCRVTYNRKNTQFKWGGSYIPEQFADGYWDNSVAQKQVKEAELMISRIVQFEVENLGDKFVLSGLGERIHAYKEGIVSQFQQQMIKDIEKFVGQFLIHNDYKKWERQSIYDMVIGLDVILNDDQLRNIPEALVHQILLYRLLMSYSDSISLNPYNWIFTDTRSKFKIYVSKLLNKGNQKKLSEILGPFLVKKITAYEDLLDLILTLIDQDVVQTLREIYVSNMDFKEVEIEPVEQKLRAW